MGRLGKSGRCFPSYVSWVRFPTRSKLPSVPDLWPLRAKHELGPSMTPPAKSLFR